MLFVVVAYLVIGVIALVVDWLVDNVSPFIAIPLILIFLSFIYLLIP
jgi:hypothetical protein